MKRSFEGLREPLYDNWTLYLLNPMFTLFRYAFDSDQSQISPTLRTIQLHPPKSAVHPEKMMSVAYLLL